MARDEWFRRTTWTEPDREEFFDRLKRSRTPGNKAQYLRIQASHLQQIGSPELARAALELLDECTTKYPEERTQMALAHLQKAQCYRLLRENEKAANSFRDSLNARRALPNAQVDAQTEFAMFVVDLELRHLFPEAEAALLEFEVNPFPLTVYQHHGCLAFFADAAGRKQNAKHHAEKALDAAKKQHSGFAGHSQLGLVNDTKTEFHKRLERLASPPPGGWLGKLLK